MLRITRLLVHAALAGSACGWQAKSTVLTAPITRERRHVLTNSLPSPTPWRQVLAREVGRMREDHLAAEPNAKWPLLTLARLQEAQARLGLCAREEEGLLLEEVRGAYLRLSELDPMRRGYYQDAVEGRAFVVVQALGTV